MLVTLSVLRCEHWESRVNDNVQGDISEYILVPTGGSCVHDMYHPDIFHIKYHLHVQLHDIIRPNSMHGID